MRGQWEQARARTASCQLRRIRIGPQFFSFTRPVRSAVRSVSVLMLSEVERVVATRGVELGSTYPVAAQRASIVGRRVGRRPCVRWVEISLVGIAAPWTTSLGVWSSRDTCVPAVPAGRWPMLWPMADVVAKGGV
eukprot:775144-Prymnesium_polylepis.2